MEVWDLGGRNVTLYDISVISDADSFQGGCQDVDFEGSTKINTDAPKISCFMVHRSLYL